MAKLPARNSARGGAIIIIGITRYYGPRYYSRPYYGYPYAYAYGPRYYGYRHYYRRPGVSFSFGF